MGYEDYLEDLGVRESCSEKKDGSNCPSLSLEISRSKVAVLEKGATSIKWPL